jgi:hypothetical protein
MDYYHLYRFPALLFLFFNTLSGPLPLMLRITDGLIKSLLILVIN